MNGFIMDGGYVEYVVNYINILICVLDMMLDEEVMLVVIVGIFMYGMIELGGVVVGESFVVSGFGVIGLLVVFVVWFFGVYLVILIGIWDFWLEIGKKLGVMYMINVCMVDIVEVVKEIVGLKGVDYVVECVGIEVVINDVICMINCGGKVCFVGFLYDMVIVDLFYVVKNNIYFYGIWGEGKSVMYCVMLFMV